MDQEPSQPAQEAQPAPTIDSSQQVAEPQSGPQFAWQASEFIHHDKRATWFIGLFGVTALLVAYFVWTRSWTSLVVVLVMAVAVAWFGVKQPRTLDYSLEDDGLRIGAKLYGYDQFKSFSVMPDVAWHSIELEPLQRFMPRLTIYFDDQHLDQIASILGDHLPRSDRRPDIIDRISRYLQF